MIYINKKQSIDKIIKNSNYNNNKNKFYKNKD